MPPVASTSPISSNLCLPPPVAPPKGAIVEPKFCLPYLQWPHPNESLPPPSPTAPPKRAPTAAASASPIFGGPSQTIEPLRTVPPLPPPSSTAPTKRASASPILHLPVTSSSLSPTQIATASASSISCSPIQMSHNHHRLPHLSPPNQPPPVNWPLSHLLTQATTRSASTSPLSTAAELKRNLTNPRRRRGKNIDRGEAGERERIETRLHLRSIGLESTDLGEEEVRARSKEGEEELGFG